MEHFDYSPEQWQAIEEVVRKVRKGDLTEFEKRICGALTKKTHKRPWLARQW
jgi:hypothetical protein